MRRTPLFARARWLSTLGLLLAIAWLCPAATLAIDADVVLRGGLIYDGTGAASVVGDVAIADGKIVAVGTFETAKVGREIDCKGLIVSPGFIDLHTHCDKVATDRRARPNLCYLTQGCTTVVTGNCGGGAVDVADYFRKIDAKGAGTNVIHLVPLGSVRSKVMGNINRQPTPEELQRMRQLVDQGMRDGAWGMSTGLIYPPGSFAKTDEVVELAKVVASHRGIYASHIRGETGELLRSVAEAIEIGRAAGLPVHISHFKVMGKTNWGLVREAARLIENAQRSGMKVTADQYPYIASSTGLGNTLFPATEVPGGRKDFAKRIKTNAEFRRQVREICQRRLRDNPRIVIAVTKNHPEWVGKSLDEIASGLGMDLVDAAIEIQISGDASVVKFAMSEDDVRWVMKLPWVATASDGSALYPLPDTHPHPRSYGTFPRKITYYAGQEKVIPLAQALRSATGLPADILGLERRGYLRMGYVADVVVFDPKEFIDRATFDEPQQYSTGVRYLFLSGNPTIDQGTPSKTLYGRVIRHKAKGL